MLQGNCDTLKCVLIQRHLDLAWSKVKNFQQQQAPSHRFVCLFLSLPRMEGWEVRLPNTQIKLTQQASTNDSKSSSKMCKNCMCCSQHYKQLHSDITHPITLSFSTPVEWSWAFPDKNADESLKKLSEFPKQLKHMQEQQPFQGGRYSSHREQLCRGRNSSLRSCIKMWYNESMYEGTPWILHPVLVSSE